LLARTNQSHSLSVLHVNDHVDRQTDARARHSLGI